MPVTSLPEPSASASRESLADWLELSALFQRDRNSSLIELSRALHRSGTTDAMPRERSVKLQERCYEYAEDAFATVDERSQRCGEFGDGYPFHVDPDGWIEFHGHRASPLYIYLLLLSAYGKDAYLSEDRIMRGEKIFEDVSTVAAREFLGYEDGVSGCYSFGSPRTTSHSAFVDAARYICSAIGEGGAARANAPRIEKKKDAGLDVVAWRGFPDRMPSQLIGFGQCATGGDWRSKYRDLCPMEWWGNWMMRRPGLFPISMFFVPHSLAKEDWDEACAGTRLVFDRCRIVAQISASEMKRELRLRYRRWSREVIASESR